MALPDLIARLERDAEARIAELMARTEAEAETLLAEASRATQTHRDEELTARRLVRRARLDRELSEARHRARADRLNAQHALLTTIFDRARVLIPAIAASAAYAEVLPTHLLDALRYVEGLRVIVRCAPAFTERLKTVLAGRDDVAIVEEPQLAAGLTVSTPDETVFIDDTLVQRLSRLEPRLRVELLAEVSS